MKPIAPEPPLFKRRTSSRTPPTNRGLFPYKRRHPEFSPVERGKPVARPWLLYSAINYLIPIDAKEPGTTEFWDESVKLV